MSLLTMLQEAADLIGVPRPPGVVAATDQTVRSLLSLARVEGRLLAARGAWQGLVAEAVVTMVPGLGDYSLSAIAADFDRIIPESVWNRTTNRPLTGPLSSRQWQALKGQGLAPPAEGCYRIMGGGFHVHPLPVAVEQIAFEYLSANWCTSAAGVGQSTWLADSDQGVLPEGLMSLGVVWRFKKAKGFEWQADFKEYEDRVHHALAQSGGAPSLSITGHTLPGPLGRPRVGVVG
ncbi:MAG: hypothetical protein HQL82_10835 [Magnetococcales bacterium]|nr:hypothetical protein [Magnetococcales bacterium]